MSKNEIIEELEEIKSEIIKLEMLYDKENFKVIKDIIDDLIRRLSLSSLGSLTF